MKERETNYNPVLENIRFMIGQLNTELKARHLRWLSTPGFKLVIYFANQEISSDVWHKLEGCFIDNLIRNKVHKYRNLEQMHASEKLLASETTTFRD